MSSSNTQRAGKSSRDRGNKSPSATTQSPKSVTATDGHAKPPDGFIPKVQPTPEQIRLAQIINDPTKQDDPDIKNKVLQVMEVTGQSSDAVVIALHDCDNDPTRAITMLIEGNKQEGEWETRGKKKKPVKEANQPQAQPQKGDQGGGPVSSNKENRGGPRGEGGPPRNTPRGSGRGGGGGGRGGSWKNKENEKNERNLEDGRAGDRERGGDMRPRGGSRRGGRGGRGGGSVGGRGSRTFQNRGFGHEGFPQSMDTWTNSTSAGQSRGGQQQDSMPVGNWNNDLAASEDWSEEDWTGQLETKVFTASGVSATPTPAPDTASIMQLLKETPHETLSVAQYNQQATESIKAAVGVGSSAASSMTNSTYLPAQSATASGDVVSVTASKPIAPAPQRTKTPKVRVPPPSKIPESAVEMPEDSVVSSLDVQFGGLEFGTDTFDFGATDGLAAVSTSQSTMPPGLAQAEQASIAPTVPSSTPYLDGHHAVNKGTSSTGVPSSPVVPLGAGQVTKDASTAGSVSQQQSQPSQQPQQQPPSQPSAAPPSAALSRPPGIPAPKEAPAPLGNSVPTPTANALGAGAPASSATSAAVAASATSASHKPPGGSGMGPEHLLLQSQQHSERSKPVSSSSVAGPQSKMYAGGAAAAAQRTSQGLEGGLSAGGKVEQPMYSSAGGHHYGGAYQAGGAAKGLVGSYLAHTQGGFPSSTAGQHYYAQQQPVNSTTAAFSQQQSNGYQGPYQSNAYSGPSQQQPQANYGVSAKLSSSGGLGPHSVKDSVLDSASQQVAATQHTYENAHVVATAGGLPSGPASTLATTASSLAGATATTSVLKNSMSATGKTMPAMPPGVPAAMLGHQFLVGNAAMPYYGLQQQPLYSYEDLQVLQTRMPHLGYYDMQYPVPATSLAGRDLTLNNMAYAEGNKFGRGENSDSSPGTVGPQGAAAGAAAGAQGAQGGQQGAPPAAGQQAASQPFLNTLPPAYGYYFPSNIMPGSIHHYGPPPMFPSFEKPGFLAGSQPAAAAPTAGGHQQQQPGGSAYPQFAGPRGSPPSLAKQQQQPGAHMRQNYPYWGN
ncbi:ubiquitin-associated protein-like lingerer isoform X2 [Amblyomma americanum]